MKINEADLPNVRGKYLFGESLKNHTWLNVGGPADVMFLPEDENDLCHFLQNKPKGMPFFVLGGGSNLLVRDKGVEGVVIKLQSKAFSDICLEGDVLQCGSGIKNFSLRKIIEEKALQGLEFLCSILGSLGGAVRGNAGCFGAEIADVLISARIMNMQGEIEEWQNKDFSFAYRHSSLPSDKIILDISLKAPKGDIYKIKEKIANNDTYRKTHQPQGIRTAGSTFKNPAGYRAWELIKNSGATNIVVGGARMSPQHCNFLQNDGTATAQDLETLGNKVVDMVKEKTGINLEWEVKIVGKE